MKSGIENSPTLASLSTISLIVGTLFEPIASEASLPKSSFNVRPLISPPPQEFVITQKDPQALALDLVHTLFMYSSDDQRQVIGIVPCPPDLTLKLQGHLGLATNAIVAKVSSVIEPLEILNAQKITITLNDLKNLNAILASFVVVRCQDSDGNDSEAVVLWQNGPIIAAQEKLTGVARNFLTNRWNEIVNLATGMEISLQNSECAKSIENGIKAIFGLRDDEYVEIELSAEKLNDDSEFIAISVRAREKSNSSAELKPVALLTGDRSVSSGSANDPHTHVVLELFRLVK